MSVEVKGADRLQRELRGASGDLRTIDLSEIVDELKTISTLSAPRRTGAGVASFATSKAGGVDSFTVGLLYMSVQEFGSRSRHIPAKHFVGHALDLMRGGRAADIADGAVSDLLAANHLGS